eukprot:4495871-Alexandrium_andersonii.AAC.1
MGAPISSEFGPGIQLFRAFRALGPQPPAAGCVAEGMSKAEHLRKVSLGWRKKLASNLLRR